MHQVLESEMRQVLAELSLLQYGSVQRWNASCGGDGAGPPAGESRPLAEVYWLEWLENPTRDTVDMARAELDAWKRSVPVETDGSTEDDWIIEDGEGLSPAEAALKFKRTPSYVRNLRAENGLSTETGFVRGLESAHASKDERIVNLAAQGCTERQIAFQVGVGKSTVRRALGRAA
jgi:hypothetical protein